MTSGDTQKIGAALVVGGGIAGVQAALDLAESGIKVYLLEKSPAIGGHMAQLDKTFPTNDCAMCILSPKLVEAGRHRNIEILTNAELTTLGGQAGDFTATVLRKARYVDISECTSCNECTAVCPVKVPDEFNEGLQTRKAIYRPYAQAVPNTFIIEKKGRAPCTNACPAGVSAQGYIALIQQRRYTDALRLIRERIPFATVCGRTCHHPCEGRCNRRYIDEPVSIQALKRFVTDRIYLGYLTPPEKVPRTRDEWVAIVGAGPAGLTAAQDLVKMGYGVTVFEALPEPGGMMRVGIPQYRLPKDVLRRDIADILALGVELKLNSPIQDPLKLLEQGYNAVYLAVGTYGEPRLNIEGEDLEGVIPAIALLRDVGLGKMEGMGEKVAVIGGGITAVDAATTALRLGAKGVSLIYRRGRGEIPAYEWELAEAESEGVRLIQWAMPLRILGDNGRVVGLECAETKARGREEPKPVPGTEFALEVDTVIRALGQSSDLWYMDCVPDTYLGDAETLATHVPGIFAGAGQVPGAGFIINAIALGHQAATCIDRYLRGEPLKPPPKPKPPVVEWTREEAQVKLQRGEVTLKPRVPRPLLPLKERVERFLEVDMGYTESMALAEAARCLNCGLCSECGECAIACQRGAINYDDVDRLEELKVGAVVLAPGYKPYDAHLSEEYGLGRYPNVVTSLQFERLVCASGPTAGHVLRPSDQKDPKRIAFLQCVGSRDRNHNYCSAVCCMYATKEAILAREHTPDVGCKIFVIDKRAFGKGFDDYTERAQKDYGIRYIRSRIPAIAEDPSTHNLKVTYETEDGQLVQEEFDLMVLSVGLEPPPDARKLAQTVGIELDERGFCQRNPFHPVETTRPGIYVCGTFAEPKDIPESVTEASGAAAAALATIGQARGTLITEKVYPPEVIWLEDGEPRIGVFICSCGSNIAGVVNVNDVVEYARTLSNVVHAENTLYTCSADSLKLIQERIKEFKLNRVIVSACTPRTHEPIFQDTIREAGLNSYFFEMANIRDQDSWVHSSEPEAATVKAKDLTRMAVARSRLLMPLYTEPQSLSHEALVIGGGVAGMTAALNLAEQGFGVYLVERERELGGRLRQIYYTADGSDPQAYLRELVSKVQANPRIQVLTGYEVVKSSGFVGNFKTTVTSVDAPTQRLIEHGVTIVATGGQEYRGSAYLLGQDSKVITQSDLEKILGDKGEGALDSCRSVVMIQCVGPWDDGSEDAPDFYCSRVCCTVALKNAMAIKKRNPEANVYILYKDMRTYGFKEALYTQARDQGVIFLRYDDENKPQIQRDNGQLQVTINDPILQTPIVFKPDLLVLSEAMVSAEGSQELAKLLKFSCTLEGFFLEAHVKLRPVDFPAEGIFLCGAAHYPKFIDEAIAQANAAAARATTILSKDVLQVGGVVAVVDEEKCTGCLTCVRICPYDVPRVNPSKVGAGGILGVAEIAAAACQGCGSCAAECPAKAIQLQHYRDEQIMAKEEALFEELEEVLFAGSVMA